MSEPVDFKEEAITQARLAVAYDPDAFEEHPIEARSTVAAIQWAARRKLAADAATRALPFVEGILAERDALRTQLDSMTVEWGIGWGNRGPLIADSEATAWGAASWHTKVFKRRVSPWTVVPNTTPLEVAADNASETGSDLHSEGDDQ